MKFDHPPTNPSQELKLREMSGRGLSPDLCCLRLVVVCCPGCLCVSRPSAVGLVWPVLCVLLLLSPVGLWLLAYLCSLVLWWSLGCLCVCSVCVLPVFACVCLCFLKTWPSLTFTLQTQDSVVSARLCGSFATVARCKIDALEGEPFPPSRDVPAAGASASAWMTLPQRA